jgi:hypothetical protein
MSGNSYPKVKRLDMFLWFEGSVDYKTMKEQIHDLFHIKGLKPRRAEWGVAEVVEEDIGELPCGDDTSPTTKTEETKK